MVMNGSVGEKRFKVGLFLGGEREMGGKENRWKILIKICLGLV